MPQEIEIRYKATQQQVEALLKVSKRTLTDNQQDENFVRGSTKFRLRTSMCFNGQPDETIEVTFKGRSRYSNQVKIREEVEYTIDINSKAVIIETIELAGYKRQQPTVYKQRKTCKIDPDVSITIDKVEGLGDHYVEFETSIPALEWKLTHLAQQFGFTNDQIESRSYPTLLRQMGKYNTTKH